MCYQLGGGARSILSGCEFTHDDGFAIGLDVDTTQGISGLGVEGEVFASEEGLIEYKHSVLVVIVGGVGVRNFITERGDLVTK